MKLAEILTSVSKKVRLKGYRILRRYIQRPQKIGEKDMYLIWYSIHQSYWILDKTSEQENICETLAGFLYDFDSSDLLLTFLKGFWWMMCTVWGKIDHWRVSKYMRLVRIMYHEILQVLIRRNWDMILCRAVSEQICNGPLNGTKDRRGICNHMCDIFFEELEQIVFKKKYLPFPTFFQILNPFLKLFTLHKDKFYVKRCKEKLFQVIFKQIKEKRDYLELFSKISKLSGHISSLNREKSLEQKNRNFLYNLKRDLDIVLHKALLIKSKQKIHNVRQLPFSLSHKIKS